MEKEVSMFLEEIKSSKNASRNTCLSYGRDLRKFADYLGERSITRWSRVSEKTIKAYLEYLHGQGKADSTISRNIASFKSFFGYLYENALIMENPAEGLVPPKIRKNKPVTLSEQEMDAFLAQDFGDTPKGIRDYTMLLLISQTGIRVSELVALEVSDLDLAGGSVICRGRARNAEIPINEHVTEKLTVYLENARPELAAEDTKLLFTNYAGGPLSRQGFWKMLKSYGRTMQFDVKVTPHTFTNYYKVCVNQKKKKHA